MKTTLLSLVTTGLITALVQACGPAPDADPSNDTDTDSESDPDSGTDTDSDSDADAGDPGVLEPSTYDPAPWDNGCVRRVDGDVSESGDGLSWATAFRTVQEGIDAARAAVVSDQPCAVWVAQGAYYIYQSTASDSVVLHPPVGIFGGFSGFETSFGQRDPTSNITILDGKDSASGVARVTHVITLAEDSTSQFPSTIIDGFTIRNGDAIGSSGGAAHLSNGDLTVFSDCVFEGNEAEENGGAVFASESSVRFHDTVFRNNSASLGGAIYSEYRYVALVNCLLHDNSSVGGGGAIYSAGSDLHIWNSTLHGNESPAGAGVQIEFGSGDWEGGLTMYNTISRQNGLQEISVYEDLPDGLATVKFSDIEGGFPGYGNIDADPSFEDEGAGDFQLAAGSPCIDAASGDAAGPADLAGSSRVDDPATPDTGYGSITYADIGAYEFQP